MNKIFTFFILITNLSSAWAAPVAFTELLKYVQPAPDQGRTGTCLFVATTGAVELLSNKKSNIIHPLPGGKFDLAEGFAVHAPENDVPYKSWFEKPLMKFNNGFGIHISSWPFDPWDDGEVNNDIWNDRVMDAMKKVAVPAVDTVQLFNKENRYATDVLTVQDVELVKEAMAKFQSPIMINYNDNNYWHVILLVGYDSRLNGDCYQITKEECNETMGAFYIRDSFGPAIELRDSDWFRVKGNAAFIVKEKD
jgi:hypothetical protein